jgi:flagellar biosynthetic protein FliO
MTRGALFRDCTRSAGSQFLPGLAVVKRSLATWSLLGAAIFLLLFAVGISARPAQSEGTLVKTIVNPPKTNEGQPENLDSGKNAFEPPPVQSLPNGDTGVMGSGIRASGALLLILGSILLITFFLKRFLPRHFGALGERRFIEIIESASLGEKRSLSIVKVGEEHFLIASTPGSVSLLERLVMPDEREAEDSEGARGTSHSSFFERMALSLGLHTQKALGGQLLPGEGVTIPQAIGATRDTTERFEDVMRSELNSSPISAQARASQCTSRLAEIRRGLQSH